MGWQWHQLDHMQIICTSLQTDNHTSTSPLSFYRPDALPATQPTAWKHLTSIILSLMYILGIFWNVICIIFLSFTQCMCIAHYMLWPCDSVCPCVCHKLVFCQRLNIIMMQLMLHDSLVTSVLWRQRSDEISMSVPVSCSRMHTGLTLSQLTPTSTTEVLKMLSSPLDFLYRLPAPVALLCQL